MDADISADFKNSIDKELKAMTPIPSPQTEFLLIRTVLILRGKAMQRAAGSN